MKANSKYISIVFCFLLPAIARAQSVGQVECPRSEGYVYLYSSMTTLDVRTTLQCGEQVQITGRYDGYFGVRTAKGETGYMPQSDLVLLKDTPGPRVPQPPPPKPARARTAYDERTVHPEPPSSARSGSDLTLLNGTPIRLKLGKTISSASAHVGDVVELEVLEDVVVDGITVIPRGAAAVGVVTKAEPKKRMGRGGKLGLSINFVRLSDNEKAAVRSYQEGKGSDNAVGAALPLASGKDVTFVQGTEFTAYVDGDMYLKKEAFEAAKDGAGAVPAPPAQSPSQPRGL